MTAALVDSNVLLDLFTRDPVWYDWSSQAVADAANTSRVVINAIIYAEASIRFSRIEEFEEALSTPAIEREPIPYEAAFLAGKMYSVYRRRRGNKTSPLPDFFIGAHAAIAGYRLITRDAARVRTYFPQVRLITPKPTA
jgi:predicted nucleic acid-binding protein